MEILVDSSSSLITGISSTTLQCTSVVHSCLVIDSPCHRLCSIVCPILPYLVLHYANFVDKFAFSESFEREAGQVDRLGQAQEHLCHRPARCGALLESMPTVQCVDG